MNKKILCVGLGLFYGVFSYSQEREDSLKILKLKEVTIVGKTGLDSKSESKPLSSVDEYIENQGNISLVKRGNYASEPLINNMASERTSVTIDGMKIFCACTDKMDPVTSYVEIINLSKMHIGSGIGGNPYAANSIGGSIDMELHKAGFHEKNWNVNANTGYETNGNYRILGGALAYSSPLFYSNSGIFFRKSDNYLAGGRNEVDFSQFEKLNLMSNVGFRFSENRIIEGTIIYDVASNIGYPALTMDVKSAKGLITSLSYRKEKLTGVFSEWETKAYFNSIVHIMDDTKRPDVVMHMDMPGKSKTFGGYTILKGSQNQHSYVVNFDSYYNQSMAEMTMYPKDTDKKPMFMYTWPDVRTFNTSVFLEDKYQLNLKNIVQISTKLALQRDGVQSDFGLNTLQIYYPAMYRYKTRFLWNFAGKHLYILENMQFKIGGGYGLRAPSPSESYGFYLYNTFDNYDYIGNPQLKNESSWEANLSFAVTKDKFMFNIDVSYFYFYNYIIGKPATDLSSMTIGASGVKVYENLPYATILNTSLNLKYLFFENLTWNSRITYSRGQDDSKNNLPLIAPLSYNASLSFRKEKFTAETGITGAARQTHFSQEYGEDETGAYLIANISTGYVFRLNKTTFNLKSGVENLFDTYYSTYSDWKNIPRKGRNFFVNLGIDFL
jgi:iron complex outermembrane recepter protein